jgi:hypothetical protein
MNTNMLTINGENWVAVNLGGIGRDISCGFMAAMGAIMYTSLSLNG